MKLHKTSILIFFLLLFTNIFFVNTVFADNINTKCNATPDTGTKFIKYYITQNSSIGMDRNHTPPDGGQIICIQIPQEKTTLSYNEMKQYGQIFLTFLRIQDDTMIRVNPYLGGGGIGNIAREFTFRIPLANERYIVNDLFYVYFAGEEKGSNKDQTVVISCRQALYAIEPGCQSAEFDNITSLELAKKFSSDSLGPTCKKYFEECVLEQTNPSDTPADPNASDPRYGKPPGYEGPLPDCAFSYNGCRSINDVLQFLVNLGQQVFKYIGTFAFVMFIYGGFTMILSMGSAEKVKKGQEILTAAVVGIIISFGAYLLIDFILDALQVGQDFRSIGALEKSDEIPGTSSKK